MPAIAPASNEVVSSSNDHCAVCGREVGTRAFAHIYRDGGAITLCDARCADRFLHRDDTENGGPSLWAGVSEYVHL
jgi:CRISPR/Cas system-associated protein Cas10 (large subunit of type III CRISPR-Cas system)